MEKKSNVSIVKLLMFFITIVVTVFALVPINKNYKADPWMNRVDDNKLITQLSIPGSHDSGSPHSLFEIAGKCQDINIQQQLNIGVRFFDIRLQQVNDKFKIVHSFVDQDLMFEDVLEDLVEFIEDYPSEFLLVSIKKDADSKKSNKGFEQLLLEYFEDEDDENIICLDSSLPSTLKQARGKIYILSRYASSTIGIPSYDGWEDSTSFTLNNMYIQDNYKIDSCDEKIQDIKKTIEVSKNTTDQLVINFTSCHLASGFPPKYAGTAALKINRWFSSYIENTKDNLGIIVADFVTKELVESIYMRNL